MDEIKALLRDAQSGGLAATGELLERIAAGAAPPELAHGLGLLREHISLGNVRDDGSGQSLLQHSLEVAELAGLVAERLGLDAAKARRAGLLHEMGKVLDDGSVHHERGAPRAAELGEDPEIVEAIANHHERARASVRSASASTSRRPALRSAPPTPFRPTDSRTIRRRSWRNWRNGSWSWKEAIHTPTGTCSASKRASWCAARSPIRAKRHW